MAANVYGQAGAAMSFWSAQCQANAAERCPALRLGDSSWSMTGAKAVAHRRSGKGLAIFAAWRLPERGAQVQQADSRRVSAHPEDTVQRDLCVTAFIL